MSETLKRELLAMLRRDIRKLRESQRPDRSSMRPILDRLGEIERMVR